jgi:predicted metalloprotease with PDZ domain
MPNSPAAQAGMMPDDLILFLNGEILIQSCKALREELEYIDRDEMVKLTVIRDQELLQQENGKGVTTETRKH